VRISFHTLAEKERETKSALAFVEEDENRGQTRVERRRQKTRRSELVWPHPLLSPLPRERAGKSTGEGLKTGIPRQLMHRDRLERRT